jgi:hypothetical protein
MNHFSIQHNQGPDVEVLETSDSKCPLFKCRQSHPIESSAGKTSKRNYAES